jgi:hypothetical protein
MGTFSLTDTAADESQFSALESEVNRQSSAEPPEIDGEPAAAARHPTPVDVDLIHSIVQKVVTKMSPPALSQGVLEDITQKISGEIIADLIAESS